jgi:predicted dehydrogenase
MNVIKCAIVGCGKIAGDYDTPESDLIRTHAKSFLKNTNCNLVGVSDIVEDTAKCFSETWGASFYSTDVDDLLSECKPDLLSICAPTETHFKIFKKACLQGVSKIWLEKPATSSIEELEEMIKLAKKYHVDVWVNYFRRYDAGFQKVKDRLPELGKIQHIQATYTKGFRHNGSHLIDLIYWFFEDIKKVKIVDLLPDAEFPSISGIFYSDPVKIYFTALDYHYFELFEVDIIGSHGRIIIKNGGQQILFQKVVKSKFYDEYRNLDTYEVHNSSFGMSMKNGLERGINDCFMPGLPQEMNVQKTIELCSRKLKTIKL